jgi:hypothetical protein
MQFCDMQLSMVCAEDEHMLVLLSLAIQGGCCCCCCCLLQGNEEAQAMFVTTGGLDMLLTRTLQHTQQMAAVGADAIGGGAPPDLLLRLLVFLQTLLGWGIGESVRRGALCCALGFRDMWAGVCPVALLLDCL